MGAMIPSGLVSPIKPIFSTLVTAISVDTSGGSLALPSGGDGSYLVVCDSASVVGVKIRLGDSSLAATGDGLMLPANQAIVLDGRGYTHIALEATSGTLVVTVSALANGNSARAFDQLKTPPRFKGSAATITQGTNNGTDTAYALPTKFGGEAAKYVYIALYDSTEVALIRFGDSNVSSVGGMGFQSPSAMIVSVSGRTHFAIETDGGTAVSFSVAALENQ